MSFHSFKSFNIQNLWIDGNVRITQPTRNVMNIEEAKEMSRVCCLYTYSMKYLCLDREKCSEQNYYRYALL